MKSILKEAAEYRRQLEENASASTGISKEISRLLEEVEKNRRTIEENEQKAASSSAKITTVLADANSLEAQIREYESDFEAFQAALDQRDRSFREGNETLSALRESLAVKDADIDSLVSKAKEMLGGATVAGLSHAYKAQFENMGRQLSAAKAGFYTAVGFLFISVIAAVNLTQISDALHRILEAPSQQLSSQQNNLPSSNIVGQQTPTRSDTAAIRLSNNPNASGQNVSTNTGASIPQSATSAAAQSHPNTELKEQTSLFGVDAPAGVAAIQALTNVASRFLVILPGLLLIGFAAKRHSALFKLREQYSHKWAIAASVEGFKTQAPNYKEPIAAAVFTELLKNPAHGMDQPAASHGKNGFLDRLIKPAVDRTLEKMGVISDKSGAD